MVIRNCILVGFFILIFIRTASSDEPQDLITIEDLLNTKISTASKYEQTITEAPASITIITSEDIKNFGYQTLFEILNNVKGFYSRDDLNYEFVGLRGLERLSSFGASIKILVNGHDFNEILYDGSFYGCDKGIDPRIIDRIEIVHGPGSVLYGTGGMMSVVNIITKSPADMPLIQLSAEGGGNNTAGISATYSQAYSDNSNLLISLTGSKTDGAEFYFKEYDSAATNYGVADGLDYEECFGIMSTANIEDFSLQILYASSEKGLVTASYGTIFNDNDAYTKDTRLFAELSYRPQINEQLRLLARTYYDYYKYFGQYPYEIDGSREIEFDQNIASWAGIELQAIYDFLPSNTATFGIEYKNIFRGDYKLWFEDTVTYYFDNPYGITSFYLQDNWGLSDEVILNLGIRYDLYSESSDALSPRIAMIYKPFAATTFKLIAGHAFRTPNYYELYYEDNLAGALSNNGLKPETLWLYEFNVEQLIWESFYLSFSCYKSYFDDLIFQEEVSEGSYQHLNTGRVDGQGLELGITIRQYYGFNGFMSATYQSANDNNSSNSLENLPEFLFRMGLNYEILQGLTISADSQAETGRITLGNNKTPTYILLNLHFIYNPQFGDDNNMKFFNDFDFWFRIWNVFDTEYFVPGANEVAMDMIPQYGQRFLFGINYRIQ
jgi:outer membrane receptor for ferrienterochelin and colicins